ncbi:MAG TPA: DUF4920 domain-containing protein [Aequorivita sp.]|nr:DUF4920 domain-containing protein [Aequorivita sp.]
MKKILLALAVVGAMSACKNDKTQENSVTEVSETENVEVTQKYQSIGDEITDESVLSTQDLLAKYEGLKTGDTLNLKFTSIVKEVCQNKGCWMKVDLGEKEAMVRFKDYGFFMPKNLAGQEVIMAGKAYIEEMSVEDQRHYAEDGGATPEEIAAITEPKKTLSFEANGVLIPETQNQ